jgi:hypothetical protein
MGQRAKLKELRRQFTAMAKAEVPARKLALVQEMVALGIFKRAKAIEVLQIPK